MNSFTWECTEDAVVSFKALGTTPSSLQTASMAAHGGNAIPPIYFFKIILKTNLQRLKIPNKFARRYESGLPNPVFIKPPDDTQWKVYWTKQNGEVWLEKGWKEFVEHYSLDQGHFIFFKYEGTFHVDVLILDQSALEINYPSCDTCDKNDNLDHNDDESDIILDEWAEQMRGKFTIHGPLGHSTGEKSPQRTSSLNWPMQTRAQEVASSFISYNPFFTVFIKPVHVADNRMPLPDLKGIIENKEKYVMLQIGERSWNVKLIPIIHNSFSHCRFSAGWSLFASEIELQPGDVCVFELISRDDSVFKVHVFKRHSCL